MHGNYKFHLNPNKSPYKNMCVFNGDSDTSEKEFEPSPTPGSTFFQDAWSRSPQEEEGPTMMGGCISELLSLRLSELLQSGWLVDRVPVARRHIKKRTEDRTKLLRSEAKAALAVCLNELNADGELSPTVYVFRSCQADDWPIGRVQDWRKASARERLRASRMTRHTMASASCSGRTRPAREAATPCRTVRNTTGRNHSPTHRSGDA
jgi:hypothetical protein